MANTYTYSEAPRTAEHHVKIIKYPFKSYTRYGVVALTIHFPEEV